MYAASFEWAFFLSQALQWKNIDLQWLTDYAVGSMQHERNNAGRPDGKNGSCSRQAHGRIGRLIP
jgi:hypothetical protein